MKKFLNNMKTEADAIRMTKAEKSAMLARILGAPSPMTVQKSPYVFLSFVTHEVRMVMAGFMLFIVAGVGTVSAAAGALPGDVLYPVKLSINEKVEMALQADGASKVALEARLAERRVEEAQSLAVQGRLDAKAADTLAASFDVHAQNAQDLADALEGDEPGISEQVKTKLSASLAVHGAVLKTLGKGSASNTTKEQSDALGNRVIARAEGPVVAMNARSFAAAAPSADIVQLKSATNATGGAPVAMEAVSLMVASDTAVQVEDPLSQKKAARLQKKAAEAIADARELFNDTKQKLDATTTAQIEKSFADAETNMSAGAAALGSGSYALSQEHFMAAFQIGGKLEALLKAERRFDNGILRTLITTELPEAWVGGTVPLNIPGIEAHIYTDAPADTPQDAPASSAAPAPIIRLNL